MGRQQRESWRGPTKGRAAEVRGYSERRRVYVYMPGWGTTSQCARTPWWWGCDGRGDLRRHGGGGLGEVRRPPLLLSMGATAGMSSPRLRARRVPAPGGGGWPRWRVSASAGLGRRVERGRVVEVKGGSRICHRPAVEVGI
jgi:hypothetical protein